MDNNEDKIVYLVLEKFLDCSSDVIEVDICYESVRKKALNVIAKNNEYIDDMNTVVYQSIMEGDKSFSYADIDPHFYEYEKDKWESNYNEIIIEKRRI